MGIYYFNCEDCNFIMNDHYFEYFELEIKGWKKNITLCRDCNKLYVSKLLHDEQHDIYTTTDEFIRFQINRIKKKMNNLQAELTLLQKPKVDVP